MSSCTLVCKSWAAAAVLATTDVVVNLDKQRPAAQFRHWLELYAGHGFLQSLTGKNKHHYSHKPLLQVSGGFWIARSPTAKGKRSTFQWQLIAEEHLIQTTWAFAHMLIKTPCMFACSVGFQCASASIPSANIDVVPACIVAPVPTVNIDIVPVLCTCTHCCSCLRHAWLASAKWT